MSELVSDQSHAPGRASLGANRQGIRAQNERLVLTLLRRHGALAKSEIARMTGLSAQAVSVIMRGLESEGFLRRCDPVRGKVGQPSIPMRLAEEAAFFLGLKVGRRRTELVLVDFLGNLRGEETAWHDFPLPEDTLKFALAAIERLVAQLDKRQHKRIAGIGVCLPNHIWDWAPVLNVPQGAMEGWRRFSLETELAAGLDWPVYVENDASAACNAELTFGTAELSGHFLYAFVGFFVGGGLVLNGSLFPGQRGNGGALASMPIPGPGGRSCQLVEVASLSVLEREMGERAKSLWDTAESWSVDDAALEGWICSAASGLAHATASAVALCDLDALVIDGWLPQDVRARLTAATAQALDRIDLAGIRRPDVGSGTIGPMARSIGAASLPLSARYIAGAVG